MTSQHREARLRRRRLLAQIAALTSAFVAGGYSLQRIDDAAWSLKGPQEDYYWSVSQYQIAFHRMRELLRAESLGERVDPELHQLRADILESKGHILAGPSELTQYFHRVPGYAENVDALSAFQRQVGPQLQSHAVTRERALSLLPQFDQVERVLVSLSNDVRVEEMRGREAALLDFQKRRVLIWILLVAAWGLVVTWLVTLTASERFRRAAEEEAAARRNEHAAVEAMQAAVQARSNFLGMVSHELRSPLQGIVSALDLMESRLGSHADTELVGRIRRSADALDAQLRDLLTLAAGEAGRLDIRPEVFEAGELVRSVAHVFESEARLKGLSLHAHVPDEPLFVVADAKRIEQVLANLVGNAVKYTDAGRVDVELHALDGLTGELHLEVSDTGPGIRAEYLPSLFAAYTRFGSLDRQSREGSGIGLAIVRTVLAHLGGSVSVRSRPRGGTSFDVRVPVTVPHDDRVSSTRPQAERILLVDDRSEVLDALAEVLNELGCRCDTAGSAAIAANLLAARHYRLALIDLDMPVKGGLHLASETRRCAGPNANIPLIAMSAASGRLAGAQWPFTGFVEKPISRAALKRLIEPRTLVSAERQ